MNWLEKKLRCGAHQAKARGLKLGFAYGIREAKGIWVLSQIGNGIIFPTSIFILGMPTCANDQFMCIRDTFGLSDKELKAIHQGFGRYEYNGDCDLMLFSMAKGIQKEFKELYGP